MKSDLTLLTARGDEAMRLALGDASRDGSWKKPRRLVAARLLVEPST